MPARLVIEGGNPLRGEVRVSAAKNAALPAMAASLLTAQPVALDGGPDGMRVLRRIIAEAPRYLRPGGWLLMEIGEAQAGPLASLMAAEGFSGIGARRDLRDVERYIEGRWADGTAVVPLTGLAAQRMGC